MPTVANGTTFATSPASPATIDEAGFVALTYTPIRGIRSVGDIGVQHETALRNVAGATRPVQCPIGAAAFSLRVELFKVDDPGQNMLRAAAVAPDTLSFCLTAPDGAVTYFTGAPSSALGGGFTAGSIADTKVTIEIDSEIVET